MNQVKLIEYMDFMMNVFIIFLYLIKAKEDIILNFEKHLLIALIVYPLRL